MQCWQPTSKSHSYCYKITAFTRSSQRPQRRAKNDLAPCTLSAPVGFGTHTSVAAFFGEAYEIHDYDAAVDCIRSRNV